MGKKISNNCLNLVKEFEGLQLKAYKDEVGVWTIGYGITSSDKVITRSTIKPGMTITKATAEKWLEDSLNQKYLPKVLKYDQKYNWTQNELDALVSFCYNIGSIDGLTANGTRTKEQIANKILEYNKAGGKVYNGLTRRRKSERVLFMAKEFTGEYKGALRDPLTVWIKGFIQRGDDGESVEEVQKYINWLFGCGIEVDEKCGPVTSVWIGEFQRYAGIADDEKWGHASWSAAMNMKTKDRFICHLIYYNTYVKAHGKYFSYNSTANKTFTNVKAKVEKKEIAKINCIAPAVWAMSDMGFTTENFYSKLGSFKDKYTGTITKHTTRYTSGHGVGKTIKQAVDQSLLKAGDILCFEGLTHSFVYTGNKYKVYDGGNSADNKGYNNIGITLDYSLTNAYNTRKISEVIRW